MEKSIWDGPFRVSGLLGACGPKGEDEMQLFTFIGAVLLALLALSLPALAHIQHRSRRGATGTACTVIARAGSHTTPEPYPRKLAPSLAACARRAQRRTRRGHR